jgi:parallel beta-helix repeat protein
MSSVALVGRRTVARSLVTASVACFILGTTLVGTAAGDTLACGSVITTDTTLSADIGPCDGIGLVVDADGITIDLGGHSVTGNAVARSTGPSGGPFDKDQPGILVRRHTGVTVQNGSVSGFDSGVVIAGGDGNTVRRMTTVGNVNYRMLTGVDAYLEDIDPETGPFCNLGDGIVTLDSNDNLITRNVSRANGPFSGIALVGSSDNNIVRNNRVEDNNILNTTPGVNPDPRDINSTICGGIAPDESEGEPLGRYVQDIGVRVEGPGADYNLVEGNQIHNSGLSGIMIHGVIAAFGPPNEHNVIRRNHISETGAANVGLERHLHGIMLQQSGAQEMNGPIYSLVEYNTSSRNLGGGIMLDTRGPGFWGTVIRHNVVNNNGLDGIHVAGPGDPRGPAPVIANNEGRNNGARAAEVNAMFGPTANYAGTDGANMGDGCIRIVWWRNHFGTVNQPCVAAGGVGFVGGPGNLGASAADNLGALGRGNGRPGARYG